MSLNPPDLQPPSLVRWQLAASPHLRRCAQTVRVAVRRHQLWQPRDRLLVAVSGGADSLAAMLLLHALARSLGHTLVVGHVDHGLQPDRQRAIDLITQACQALDIALDIVAVAIAAGPDLEARCRQARYAALQVMANRQQCQAIVTAHHADDQAETLLLRLARGAGVGALEGIRTHRQDQVVRPLLSLSRADLRTLLGDRPFWQDPSNADTSLARNRLRATVMPAMEAAFPQSARGLARTADHLAGLEDAALHFVERALAPHTVQLENGVRIDRSAIPATSATFGLWARWLAGRLQVAPLSDAAVAQLALALASAEATSAHAAGIFARRTGQLWTFLRTDVARPTGAD